MIFSQPKISYTAFPVLPNADTIYHYPHQLIPDPLGSTSAAPAGRGSAFFVGIRRH